MDRNAYALKCKYKLAFPCKPVDDDGRRILDGVRTESFCYNFVFNFNKTRVLQTRTVKRNFALGDTGRGVCIKTKGRSCCPTQEVRPSYSPSATQK